MSRLSLHFCKCPLTFHLISPPFSFSLFGFHRAFPISSINNHPLSQWQSQNHVKRHNCAYRPLQGHRYPKYQLVFLSKCRSGLFLRNSLRPYPSHTHRSRHHLSQRLQLGHCYGGVVGVACLRLPYSQYQQSSNCFMVFSMVRGDTGTSAKLMHYEPC